ncbi:MAG TPA: CDP-glucose 4,6-dehydratase [Opitutaceae bacterium]
MATFLKSFAGKRAFVTGHTGFKGSWLCEWLLGLGAEVTGFSLPPATRPSLFNQLGLADRLNHVQRDLRDAAAVSRALAAAKPDFIFHLAAQPLVRAAHADPGETWATNVMGTVNLLEAMGNLRRPCAAIVVTTDKVYAASSYEHTEEDTIGSEDPYGASKAAVELAVAAWRRSLFPVEPGRKFPLVGLATARSGNVIGGGDWARDRLLPDCVRSLAKGEPVPVRNPSSIRPWQHVLDPLAGYLCLASELGDALVSRRASRLAELSGPFNFGPASGDQRPVRDVVDEVLRRWPGKWRSARKSGDPLEASVLRLDARKAHRVLGWRPRWGFTQAIDRTVAWYQGAATPSKAIELTRRQIREFSSR